MSFLNVGPRVATPNDNFLLFGASCKEDHPCVKQFTQQLSSNIEAIEKKTYTVSEKQVTFTFELLPSDMKFLTFLNGELNNAATYFSSFANVSKGDCITLNDKFGLTNDSKWKPCLMFQFHFENCNINCIHNNIVLEVYKIIKYNRIFSIYVVVSTRLQRKNVPIT